MLRLEGLLNIDKLEKLELNLGPEEFSKFIYFFIHELEYKLTELEKYAKQGDIDKLIILTNCIKSKGLEIGALLLVQEIIKVQYACIKNQKTEILKSVQDMKKISEKTLDAVREILLITFCLHSYRKEKNHIPLDKNNLSI